jgi:hypothetical protein
MKTFILSLSVIFAFYGCDLLDNSSDDSISTHKTVMSNGIEYSLDITRNNFLPDDTLSISFKVKNNSDIIKEFHFSNVQQLQYQIVDQNNIVAAYYPMIVSPALSHFSLGPGEMKELNQIGFFKDHNGNYINRGRYSLSVSLANNNSPKLKLRISVY